MEKYINKRFFGERALFTTKGAYIDGCVLEDGESPLKESSDLTISDCIFRWKYPIWYSERVDITRSTLAVTARSGIWYTKDLTMTDCIVDAPKTFRRCSGIKLKGVDITNADETMWSCNDLQLLSVRVVGDYFGMNCNNVECEDLRVSGNYLFDGAENVVVRNSRLMSKDAFWNCKNVKVYDSVIVGEYLGWNSENVTFVNCTIESNQGMCYMDNVKLVNCRLINTDLCFEYSRVDADVASPIISIKNPKSGRIRADSIGTIIMEDDRVDTSLTEITEREVEVDEV